MSDYAKASDLIARYGEDELVQQTDRDGSGSFDSLTVSRALSDASATIDGYLRARYALPLVAVPGLLVGLCCDLARYALWPDAVPETVEKRRDAALVLLRDIAAGRVVLEAETPTASPHGLVEFVTASRVFSRGER